MDPLADVFGLLDVQSAKFARLEASAPWGVSFSGYQHVKLGAVLQGACTISVDGVPGTRDLMAGDCYLLGNGRPYRLASSAEVRPTPSAEIFSRFVEGGTVRIGAGADTVIVGCGFQFDTANAAVLADVLPPIVHVPTDSEHAGAIRAALDLLRYETASPGLATSLVTERLAHILLVQVLRAHIAAQKPAGGVWLTALADPLIGNALTLVHESPAHRWTVAELAAKVGMSRSHFAARFAELVGTPPLEYVAQWRIRSAAHDLRRGKKTVASIASAWGYGSESAFSHAFKRAMGVSPGRYRAASRETAPPAAGDEALRSL